MSQAKSFTSLLTATEKQKRLSKESDIYEKIILHGRPLTTKINFQQDSIISS